MTTAAYQHLRAFQRPRRWTSGYGRNGDHGEVDVVVHGPLDWTVAAKGKYREHSTGYAGDLERLPAVEDRSAGLRITKHPGPFGPLPARGPFPTPASPFQYVLGHAERRAADDPGLLRCA